MSDITVEINGIKCKAKEGEFLLNVARREDIFIPAICYQTQCSPSLACRLCIVEADDKRVYACNAKAKDGMIVNTNNDELAVERKNIMQVYDVNHPLQCGVCDQSGDCELQNYTLYMDVEKQEHAIPDTFRPIRDWGLMKYDAGLCIVCEKCVTVCKDMIGDAVLKTVPRGGEALPKEFKETMPKDSYAMWNKLQKSIIGTVNEDDSLECQDCGECIAVCPVGALVSTDFQYTSNSWELTKIPVANPHSSDCSLLYYETKHGDMKNYDTKIFRVTNDSHYVSISGAARFGYDFENRVAGKDKALFDKAVDFIKNEADTIRFSSYITNEEALILQKIKEKYSLKLVNDDALAYQKFLHAYASTSGETLYNGTLNGIKASNFVVSVGTAVRYDAPTVGFAINNASTMNKGAGLYFHPVGDTVVETFSKNMTAIQNAIGSEEHVLAYILETFSKVSQELEGSTVEKLPKAVSDVVSKYDSKLVNLPEGFDLEKLLAKKDTFSLVLGEDLYHHDSAENIAKLAGLISVYTNFTVTIIPTKTNTLGVALICDLDEKAGSKVLGYNEEGDFVLSALGEGDLDMPALNQQEGTYTSLDKKVVPTNAALSYSGYVLNDIAQALGFEEALTIDFTPQLPTKSGYMIAEFDALPNLYDNAGNEVRGYDLNVKPVKTDAKLEKLSAVKEMKGDVVYLSNPINQFSAFTNKAHQLKTEGAVYASAAYLEAKGFAEGDELTVKTDSGEISAKIELDKQLSGEVVYLPTFDTNLNTKALFSDGFRFTTATIRKV
jgi:NADH-quinone oxidoreductase subunit G